MSPTIHRELGYRFFFFSREESRMHVHCQSERGEAKFWLEPTIEIALHVGLSVRDLNAVEGIIQEHYHDFVAKWKQYFER